MPEPASRRWRSSVAVVRAGLRTLHGTDPNPLVPAVLKQYHHQWRIVAGWRLVVDFGEPTPRRMDVLILFAFPYARPRIALVDRPPFLTWPHIEQDGILCLVSNMTEIDPEDPTGVVVDLLGRGTRLVLDLIAARMVQSDFKDEFLTYWRYDRTTDDRRLISILRAEEPSREVCIWQAPDIKLVGESEADVTQWLSNRFGSKALRRSRAERAMLLWLDEPMLPSEYPRNARDLIQLAERTSPEAAATLAGIAMARQDNIVALVGARGRLGPGMVAVTVPAPGRGRLRHRMCAEPLSRGFRPSRLPDGMLIDRTFGIEPVLRDEPSRADATWIHGRGHDPRSAKLMSSNVTIMGCGSVGAPIAVALAQAGTGHLTLVDHDDLSWANVGRHPLGAPGVGRNKAEALAAKLRTDYPHATFEAFPGTAGAFMARNPGAMLRSDLIVSAMGSWLAEARLNDWHCHEGRPMPAVYAWTEAHAAAGHAVVVAGSGGCLRCGVGRTGVPDFEMSAWPDGSSGASEEPAYGVHFQPYGPVELGFVTSLAAEVALDALLGKITDCTHRFYVGRKASLEAVGGRWSDAFTAMYPRDLSGGGVIERDWPSMECRQCGRIAA